MLDLACGAGRHTRFFADRGHPVVAVDRDLRGIKDLHTNPLIEVHELDLEDGRPFPFAGRRFGAVVVANYLYRPVLGNLVEAVGPGGALIYETFARGNERFGTPKNTNFLLEHGELLDVARPALEVVAYEDLEVELPKPAAVQRIAAVRR